jgi:ribosome-interacting GTPase 1
LVTINKKFKYINTIHKVSKPENLKEEIWKKLNLIYVYTKTPGKEKDFPPVSLKKDQQ